MSHFPGGALFSRFALLVEGGPDGLEMRLYPRSRTFWAMVASRGVGSQRNQASDGQLTVCADSRRNTMISKYLATALLTTALMSGLASAQT